MKARFDFDLHSPEDSEMFALFSQAKNLYFVAMDFELFLRALSREKISVPKGKDPIDYVLERWSEFKDDEKVNLDILS